MSRLRLVEVAEPTTPSALKGELFYNSATEKLCFKNDEGFLQTISPNGLRDINFVTNGGFTIQQRVAVAATAIPGVSTTTRAGKVADRWAVTTGNATTTQWTQTDAAGAPEGNLLARYYGRITQLTNAAKWILSQYVTNADMTCLRGQNVRVSVKLKTIAGTDALMNIGLLRLAAAGTPDVDPAFISAIGAAGTDPTWGTNLALCTPLAGVEVENGAVVGSKAQVTTTAAWVRYSGVFTVPADCENLVVVIFRDTLGAASDSFGIAEVQLTSGAEIIDWVTMPSHIDLFRCQRFFCKTFAQTTVPVTNAGINTGECKAVAGKVGAVANAAIFEWRFPVTMFKTPTCTVFNPAAANALGRDITGAADLGATAITAQLDSSVMVISTGVAATAVGDQCGIHITADCEFAN